MGDYLSRLVARSTGALAPVTPRPHSAYEPVAKPLHGVAWREADDSDDMTERRMPVAAPSARAGATAEPYRGPLYAPPIAASIGPAAGPTEAARPPVTGALPSHTADFRGHSPYGLPHTPVMSVASQPAAGSGRNAVPLAGGVASAGAASETQHSQRSASVTPAAATAADREARAAAHARNAADASGRDVQPRHAPEPGVVRRPEPVMPRTAAHADGADGVSRGTGHHTESSVRDDAAPVIHVSIGRIEVRAVSEPARAPTPRVVPRSLLTLDEYVRQRAKGER